MNMTLALARFYDLYSSSYSLSNYAAQIPFGDLDSNPLLCQRNPTTK